jgi:hypothetical protein
MPHIVAAEHTIGAAEMVRPVPLRCKQKLSSSKAAAGESDTRRAQGHGAAAAVDDNGLDLPAISA